MKKEQRGSQQHLLRLLKRLESADIKARNAAAKELVQALIQVCGTPERASLLVKTSIPTLYRWSSGRAAPRNLSRLKEALADPNFENHLRRLSGGAVPAEELGIHSMGFFLQRAPLASRIYIFKSFLEFGFVRSEQMQKELEQILEQNQELTIHCIFPSQSKADETLSRFCELARSFDQHWINRIKRHSVEDSEQILALGLGLTGQIILEYTTPEARKQLGGRFLDFLVEVPVRVYEQSESGVFIKRNVWIELPQDEIQSIWLAWKAYLEAKEILPAERSSLQRIV